MCLDNRSTMNQRIAAVMVIAFFGYFARLGLVGSPRLADGALDSSEMSSVELVLLGIGVIAGIYLAAWAFITCWRAGRRVLGVAALVFWPVTVFLAFFPSIILGKWRDT